MRHTRLGVGTILGSLTARAGGLVLALSLVLGAVPAAAPAQAQILAALPKASRPVAVTHHAAKPISGWVRFCEEYRAECAVDSAEPAAVSLTRKAWQTIARINRQVNEAIMPETDKDHWGVEDRWDLAEDGSGDCEDYQLVKRRLLVEAGFPRKALRMTVVIDEEGQGHAVMMVRTDRGDYILDNKRDAVLPWQETGYTYVKREGDDGLAWASLGGAVASPVATAGR